MRARIIAQLLEKRGFHAFYVGGAVAIIPSSKAPEIICLKTMLEGE